MTPIILHITRNPQTYPSSGNPDALDYQNTIPPYTMARLTSTHNLHVCTDMCEMNVEAPLTFSLRSSVFWGLALRMTDMRRVTLRGATMRTLETVEKEAGDETAAGAAAKTATEETMARAAISSATIWWRGFSGLKSI